MKKPINFYFLQRFVYGLCAIKLHFKLIILLTWHINYIRCYMLLN